MKVGCLVKVLSLKKEGVISEILGNGSFIVRVGSLSVRCKSKDLGAASSDKKKKREKGERKGVELIYDARSPMNGIDLHGLSREEARLKLIDGINNAMLSGAEMIEVIHGRGAGILRSLVWEVLPTISSVASFKETEGNSGSVTVFLK